MSTHYFCMQKGELCEYATSLGYCSRSVCTKNISDICSRTTNDSVETLPDELSINGIIYVKKGGR